MTPRMAHRWLAGRALELAAIAVVLGTVLVGAPLALASRGRRAPTEASRPEGHSEAPEASRRQHGKP